MIIFNFYYLRVPFQEQPRNIQIVPAFQQHCRNISFNIPEKYISLFFPYVYNLNFSRIKSGQERQLFVPDDFPKISKFDLKLE